MTPKIRPIVLCLVLAALAACGCSNQDDEAYRAEIDAWHAQRLERLRSETGWLTLVGLHPLGQGENRLGSARANDIVMTKKAPARLGRLSLAGAQAEFYGTAGVPVFLWQDGAVSGTPFAGGPIRTDGQGPPDMLASGYLVFYVIQRGEKYFLRVKDRDSEVLREFEGIARYPVFNSWRVTATLEGEPGTMRVANVLGQVAAEPSPGTLVFELKGQTCRLRPTGKVGEGLFVVFGDISNGAGTYPSGRFLATDPPAADGTYILDFNRAYNPPCVFSEHATCPLPGPENMLLVAITAGEKMWGSDH